MIRIMTSNCVEPGMEERSKHCPIFSPCGCGFRRLHGCPQIYQAGSLAAGCRGEGNEGGRQASGRVPAKLNSSLTKANSP